MTTVLLLVIGGGLVALGVTRGRPRELTTANAGPAIVLGAACILVGAIQVHGPPEPQAMSAACQDAASYVGNLTGVVDWAAADALEALGLPLALSFRDTPWGRPGAAFTWETADRQDWGPSLSMSGRRLARYQENARYQAFADGIPGAVEGVARCNFVQDVETGEFWFWAGGGDWAQKGKPSVRVFLDYNENARR